MKLNGPIEFARSFAALAHADAGQTYDGHPYEKHLVDVAHVLLRYGVYDKSMLAAAYLHDVVEDVGVGLVTIEGLFGPKVSALVGALTDEPGANRKERKAKTYPKIQATPGAVKLKLADRIANVENGIRLGDKRFFLMYKKEMPEFESGLRDPRNADYQMDPDELAMWNHLNYLFHAGTKKFTTTSDI